MNPIVQDYNMYKIDSLKTAIPTGTVWGAERLLILYFYRLVSDFPLFPSCVHSRYNYNTVTIDNLPLMAIHYNE